MSEIGFYHFERQPVEVGLPRLVEKAAAAGHRIYIRVGDPDRATALDELLWTYDPGSFLGHGLADGDRGSAQPIAIGVEARASNNAGLLIVADAEFPDDISFYDRCLYVFDGRDQGAVERARELWRRLRGVGPALVYWQQGDAGWTRKAEA